MQENILRGRPNKADINRAKTHCKQGHPFSGPNLYVDPITGWRKCRSCQRTWSRKSEQKKRTESTGL